MYVSLCYFCIYFIIVYGGLTVCIHIQIRPQRAAGNLSDTDTPTPMDQLASITQNSVTDSTCRSDNITRVTHKSSATASKSRLAEKSSSNSLVRGEEAANKLPSSNTSRVSAHSSTSTHAQSSSNNDSKSSAVKQRKPQSTPYVYTAVKDIKSGTLVNVFGIVKFVRPASRGRGAGELILCSLLLQEAKFVLDCANINSHVDLLTIMSV